MPGIYFTVMFMPVMLLPPNISVYGGLTNAFDRAPPQIPGAEAGGSNFNQAGHQAGLYDVIGRTFYLGIRVGL